jgi:hypothetical protein
MEKIKDYCAYCGSKPDFDGEFVHCTDDYCPCNEAAFTVEQWNKRASKKKEE